MRKGLLVSAVIIGIRGRSIGIVGLGAFCDLGLLGRRPQAGKNRAGVLVSLHGIFVVIARGIATHLLVTLITVETKVGLGRLLLDALTLRPKLVIVGPGYGGIACVCFVGSVAVAWGDCWSGGCLGELGFGIQLLALSDQLADLFDDAFGRGVCKKPKSVR